MDYLVFVKYADACTEDFFRNVREVLGARGGAVG
jgi:hypothetical protein